MTARSEKFKRWPPLVRELLLTGTSLREFDYTKEQWAEIERSVGSFKPTSEVLDELKWLLRSAAIILLERSSPEIKRQGKMLLHRFVNIEQHAHALISDFTWLRSRDLKGFSSAGADVSQYKVYQNKLIVLAEISAWAKVEAQIHKQTGENESGIPNRAPKVWYHAVILSKWEALGGKLKFSRHPTKGHITGPLARYFSAVTGPVHGGSLESLPDILDRHREFDLELLKWCVETGETMMVR